MIQEAIWKIAEGADLSRDEAQTVMREIVGGEAKPSLVTALLASLRTKGETVSEITGFASVMRDNSIRIYPSREGLLDTCGTGGDGSRTFNISTAASFVIAGAGVGVAKHGNRAVSSSCGSADILEALDIVIDLGNEAVEQCIDEAGIGFLFAQKLHPAMRYAAGPRKELGMKTVFNLLGPLTNPASVRRQLVGVFDPDMGPVLVRVLAELGAERALVVHGDDGLDEISISARTRGYYFDGSGFRRMGITPEEFGMERASPERLLVESSDESRRVLLAVIDGEDGPARDIVLLNAGAGLFVSGAASSIQEGVDMARDSIDSGKARRTLDHLRELSQKLGNSDGGP